jgi:hypothetical protein
LPPFSEQCFEAGLARCKGEVFLGSELGLSFSKVQLVSAISDERITIGINLNILIAKLVVPF